MISLGFHSSPVRWVLFLFHFTEASRPSALSKVTYPANAKAISFMWFQILNAANL